MLASMLPWAEYRVTYSEPIGNRELVQRRVGELAGPDRRLRRARGVVRDLLDRGYRGEMECIIAKIFGSEAQKHAAIELMMKTHGGRGRSSHGHQRGRQHPRLPRPLHLRGRGRDARHGVLQVAVKDHGKRYFEPVGKALAAAGIKKPNPLNPRHAMPRSPDVAAPYLKMARRRGKLAGVGRADAAGPARTATAATRRTPANRLPQDGVRNRLRRCRSSSSSWPTGSAAWRS